MNIAVATPIKIPDQYTEAPLSLSLVAGTLSTILGLVAILAAVFRV